MLEFANLTVFDYPVICRAEVDLPGWLAEITGESGWRLIDEEEGEFYESYRFSHANREAQVVLYQSGYALVEIDGEVHYDGHLSAAPGHARLQYYNAESGAPVLLN